MKIETLHTLVGFGNKGVFDNIYPLNFPRNLPGDPNQILTSEGLTDISALGNFTAYSIPLSQLNSVGANIWKGTLISWRW